MVIDATAFGMGLAGLVGLFLGFLSSVPRALAAKLEAALKQAQERYYALRNTGMIFPLTIGRQRVLLFTSDNGVTWWRCLGTTGFNEQIHLDRPASTAEMVALQKRVGVYKISPGSGSNAQYPVPTQGTRIVMDRRLHTPKSEPGLRPASQRFPA